MSSSRSLALSLVAVLAASLAACASEAPAPAPSLPPASAFTQDIAASASSTQDTGVTQWKLYADTAHENSTLVFGVDASGAVLTESRIGADLSDTPTSAAVAMESIYPEAGHLSLGEDGKVAGTDLSPASARVFGAFGQDFKAYEDSHPAETRSTWSCLAAGAELGAECGLTVAACAESAGIACIVGAPLCLAAYYRWLCECHHRC